MHQEETASRISLDDIISEIDVLLEELVGKEESLNKVGDAQSRKLKEDKSKGEDIESGDECDKKPKRQRRRASTEPLVEFMQEEAKISGNYDNKS